VGVVTAWTWPDPLANLTVHDLIAAQKAVNEGGPWRKDPQAGNWVGKPIAQALGLDVDSAADKAKIKGALKIWTANKMFKEVKREDESRKKRPCIEVGKWANADTTVVKMTPQKSKSKPLGEGWTDEPPIPVNVGFAPAGVACVQCQTLDDRRVFKIRDGRVPQGQPGGRAESLHEDCAKAWFKGEPPA
jgi:hypothetical protein